MLASFGYITLSLMIGVNFASLNVGNPIVPIDENVTAGLSIRNVFE